jgi:hypothetical protein
MRYPAFNSGADLAAFLAGQGYQIVYVADHGTAGPFGKVFHVVTDRGHVWHDGRIVARG